jgi:hypothetical protein
LVIKAQKAFAGAPEVVKVFDGRRVEERCEVVADRFVSRPSLSVRVEKLTPISPVEKLPPESVTLPCVGVSRPERVLTLMTPPSLSPNSAEMPPSTLRTVRSVRASRLVAKMAGEIIGDRDAVHNVLHLRLEPRGWKAAVVVGGETGRAATMASMPREGAAPSGRSSNDWEMFVSEEVLSASMNEALSVMVTVRWRRRWRARNRA